MPKESSQPTDNSPENSDEMPSIKISLPWVVAIGTIALSVYSGLRSQISSLKTTVLSLETENIIQGSDISDLENNQRRLKKSLEEAVKRQSDFEKAPGIKELVQEASAEYSVELPENYKQHELKYYHMRGVAGELGVTLNGDPQQKIFSLKVSKRVVDAEFKHSETSEQTVDVNPSNFSRIKELIDEESPRFYSDKENKPYVQRLLEADNNPETNINSFKR